MAALLLAVLWVAGIATRSVWTPDEPREFALSFNMLAQTQHAVPTLGGLPFAEKPPLTYWLAAGAMALFGHSPIAARLPNLLYGLLTVLCAAAWAAAAVLPAQRARAALVAGIIAGTAWLSFLHTIWLASDAPLLAASAIALFGGWRVAAATGPRERLLGYALFYLGLALAFMAKNLLGLIAPLLALGLYIAWEARWRELWRWPLWLGLLIPVLLIGAWIACVAAQADGARLLRVFLWDNSVGRFLPVASSGDYRTGHANSPLKLVSEVALGLLPWLALALAALRRAFAAAFGAPAAGATPWARSAWRYALCATLPLILLLSFSATVRDVYALPSMVGFAVLVALWWVEGADARAVSARWPLRITRGLLIGGAVLTWALALLVPWLALGRPVTGAGSWLLLLAGTAACVVAGRIIAREDVLFQGVGYFSSGLFAFFILASPAIEPGQDLRPVARQVAALAAGRPLLLSTRDETMTAALDYSSAVDGRMVADFAAARRALPGALALVEVESNRLTPAFRARLARLHPRLAAVAPARPEPLAQALFAAGWRTLHDLPNPGGRHYQLLAFGGTP